MEKIIQKNVEQLKDNYYNDKESDDTLESLQLQGSKLLSRYTELFERWKNNNDLTDDETQEMTSLSTELESLKEKMELLESKQK